jgi:hypothetical protein
VIWKPHVLSVSEDGIRALPEWYGLVPNCSGACPHHDGKRCRVTGFKPGNICEPVVGEMGKFLDEIDGPSSE